MDLKTPGDSGCQSETMDEFFEFSGFLGPPLFSTCGGPSS